MTIKTSLVMCLMSASVFAFAKEEAPRIKGGRLLKTPVIDGEVSPTEWEGAAVTSGSYLSDGTPQPDYLIEVRFGYDDKFLYVCSLLSDPNPSLIRADEYRKNTYPRADDTLSVSLGLQGLIGQYHSFTFNPRTANTVDIPGGRANKVEWSGEVDSVGKVTDKGWQVEARIPWSILRLPAKSGPADVRFSAYRSVTNTGQSLSLQYIPNDDFERTAIWEAVQIPKVTKARKLQILPYSYAGTRQDRKPLQNSGLDFKTNIGDRLELVGTINPDFRNIENSILGLDFSYFERLASESRPFFLEGADYFGSSASIFRSQRVRNIDLGAKVVGDLSDRTRLGVMALQDFGKESASVVSLGHTIDSKTSVSVGLAHSDRPGVQSLAATTGIGQRMGKLYLSGRWARHHDNIIGTGNDFSASANYGESGHYSFLSLYRRESRFRPRLGFTTDTNYQGLSVGTNLYRDFAKGPLTSYGLNVSASHSTRFAGTSYRRSAYFSAGASWRNSIYANYSVNLSRFFQNDDLLQSMSASYPSGSSRSSVYLSHTWGLQAKKAYISTGGGVGYQVTPRAYLSLNTDNVQHFTKQTLWIGSGSIDLGGNQSISTRFVRQDSDYNIYFSYRKSGGRGAEYYVILGDPNAQSFRTSLILKAVFPLEIRY